MKHVATRVAYLLLFSLIIGLPILAPSLARAQLDPVDLVLEAPGGTAVSIDRDDFGVPHIRAGTEAALFYGQGYATAQDRLWQMETFRRAATGTLSEVGLAPAAADRRARTRYYTPAERRALLREEPAPVQQLYEAYTDGLNRYVDSANANPQKYLPGEFAALGFRPAPWTVEEVVAVSQLFIRRFGSAGGEELERCAELRANGLAWLDENRPINDPAAPTTILNGTEPAGYPGAYPQTGLAQCPTVGSTTSGSNALGSGNALGNSNAAGGEEPIVIDAGGTRVVIPSSLGSFATLIAGRKSASGEAMLLGAPQLQGSIQRGQVSLAHEVELEAPGLHAGGMTIGGIPGVIVGRTEHAAWSFTTGRTDNQDTFIEPTETTSDTLSQNRYRYGGAWLDFEAIEEPDLGFTHYRTVHGPVVGRNLGAREVFALNQTFWKRELKMATALYGIWQTSTSSARQFEARVAEIPMSFNFFYADREQRVRYWHTGRYPDRGLTGVDPRLPHLGGDDAQDWQGFLPFDQLPQASGAGQPYFVNWNNKPAEWWDQGDNVPWTGAQRVDALYAYVPGGTTPFSYEDLKGVPDAIDDVGTYQQATRFSAPAVEENTLPPGQSGFVSAAGDTSRHFADQWEALRDADGDFLGEQREDFRFKDMRFASGLRTVEAAGAYDFAPLGVEIDVQSPGASPVDVYVQRAEDATQGAPAPEELPQENPKLAVEGSWMLASAPAALPSGFSADVCFALDRLTAPRESVDFSRLQIYRREDAGAPWEALATTLRPSGGGAPQQICATELSRFSEFIVSTQPGALPVELSRFEATRSEATRSGGEGNVLLTWRTQAEERNARFEVERRAVGAADAWTRVGTRASQAAGGQSAAPLTYRLTDAEAPFTAERLTYRLRQIDRDGTARVVGEATLEMGAPQAFALKAPFPNPFRRGVMVRYALPQEARVQLALYDARGRRVRMLASERQPAGRYERYLQAGRLASGTYFLHLRAGDETATRPVVLVR